MDSLTGGLREFVLLFFPILATTFSSYLFIFVEKLLLSRLSTQAMEAAVNAAYACQIFQNPCVALAMMAQVCVGRLYGAHEWKSIGSVVWQFIWFSLFSFFITGPLSLIFSQYYFYGTSFQEIVLPYFYFLVSINFLFPLGAALSCFYLGQGKTRLVLLGTLGAQLFKLPLAYILIFGWGKIPAFGLMGGAFSTLLSQGGFCLSLLGVFLYSKHAEAFHTKEWKFQPHLFWESIRPGSLRAINRILNTTSWAAIAYLMSSKGGDYLLALSVGGTLFFFLPCIGDAVCQTQTTIVSNLVGAGDYHLLNKAFYSGSILVLITISLFGVPLLLFPTQTFSYLFATITLDKASISLIFFGVWLSFVFYTWLYVPLSYVLAFKDMNFFLIMGAMNWINGFLLMYFAINILEIEASMFWLVLSLMHGSTTLLYYWRMKVLQSQVFVKAGILAT